MQIIGQFKWCGDTKFYGPKSCADCIHAFDWDDDGTCQCNVCKSIGDQKKTQVNGRDMFYDCPQHSPK